MQNLSEHYRCMNRGPEMDFVLVTALGEECGSFDLHTAVKM